VANHCGSISERWACRALGLHRYQFVRFKQRREVSPEPLASEPPQPRARPTQALSEAEEAQILDLLMSPKYVDQSPHTVYHSLLDRQVRYCSISTMYRLLRRGGQSSGRRQRRQRVCHVKPQLQALGPNQVWSWDITLLKGPIRGVFYYLYVMVDIYSRKVVAWMLAKREGEDLASNFIAQAYKREGVQPGQLTVHSDRGPSMKSLGVADLHRWLGIHQSFGRPSVSDDNPYSEAFFKTFKHCPAFPGRFESFEAAEKFCVSFFAYYNDKHYHSGICYLTPNTVHNGLADSVLEARHLVELAHYEANPKRYPAGSPKRKRLQESYWINDPVRALPENQENEMLK